MAQANEPFQLKPGVLAPLTPQPQPSPNNTFQTGITQNAADSSIAPLNWSINGYQFDAWLRLHHSIGNTITQHPVETGSTISDYKYRNPMRFSFEIGTANATSTNYLDGHPQDKLLGTYNLLQSLAQQAGFLTLRSKYGLFKTVVIESIDIEDDWRTQDCVMANVNLQEIITASTSVKKVSLMPHMTDQTQRGEVQTLSNSQLEGILLERMKANAQGLYNTTINSGLI